MNASERTTASAVDPPAVDATRQVALVAEPTRSELVDRAVEAWRSALVEESGGSARNDIALLAEAALDLSSAHPSGMAQLFAGRPTKLSNLIREGAALSTARRRARSVSARADASVQRYGVAPTSLAIGMATWTVNPVVEPSDDMAALAAATASISRVSAMAVDPAAPARTMRVPVLLRPVSVQARGSGDSDYELTLEPTIEVNPVLARALRVRGALLDPAALAASTFFDGSFDPKPALTRLAALGEAVLADFKLMDRTVVGAFVHPGQVLVDDLDAVESTLEDHEVIAALAGDEDAIAEILDIPLPGLVGDRDLATERGVGDLDDAQRRVLDVVASGAHMFIDAPTGSDVTGTIAAIVADAAAAGLTVLYVPGSRRGTAAVKEALDRLGLGDLMLDVPIDAGWRTEVTRRLLGAMTLAEPEVDEDELVESHMRTSRYRDRLTGYVAALHTPREPWGVSAFDAIQQLAALTSSRPTPRTTARISRASARAIDADRLDALARDLGRVAELGAFTIRPGDTSWYGAQMHTEAEAEIALRRVKRLLDGALDHLVARGGQIAVETGLNPAVTLDGLGEQLQLLNDIRASLDIFLPEVFERSVQELVAATAPSTWRTEHGIEIGYLQRRRLRKQAKDLVRPGRPVADLHTALDEVEQRRKAWRDHCPAGGWPRLPGDLELVEDEFAAVRRDVEALEEVFTDNPRLTAMGLAELADQLLKLRADARSLDGLPERASLLAKLNAAGLGPVISDLQQRQVGVDVAPLELELAWWSTAFEEMLITDPELGGYDGAALDDLSEQYAVSDREMVAARSVPLLRHVVAELQKRLRRHRDEGEALFLDLVEESIGSLRDTMDKYPNVARYLRPVLAASPMVVPAVLPPTREVDLVVLDAVGHLPTEAAVPALARGRQIVVVGDARCATKSAVRDLAEVLPTVALHADGTRRDPHLTAFLAEHGYAGVLTPVPLPESMSLVHFHRVDGTGMPDATGVVDSTREEVATVVDLVLSHALICPAESLAVVTGTSRHGDAIRDAVLSEVRDNPVLQAFFDVGKSEPFVVVDLAGVAGLSRDAIVLSVGLGRTPHRRVLHQFGPISERGGDGLLLDALGSTRHRLDVVACFGAHDLDPHRLRGPGPRLLADLLDFARRRDLGQSKADPGTVGDARGAPTAGADPVLLDVAERLWRHGLDVELDHGLPGGVRIPLVVGHPSMPGRFLVAVLTDDDAYVAEPSVRTRDRLVADRLRDLGWSVVRIWSVAAFLDPQAEVDRVRRVVHGLLPQDVRMPTGRTLPVPQVESARSNHPRTQALETRAIGAQLDLEADSETGYESEGSGLVDDDGQDPIETIPVWDEFEIPPRPDVARGLKISAYSDDELDALAEWLIADGQPRTLDELARDLRVELGVTRRGHRVDSVIHAAVTRALVGVHPPE